MASKHKKVVICEEPSVSKQPKIRENPDAYLKKVPTWSFKRADSSYSKWKLQDADDLYYDVIQKLQSYEGMTWADVLQASGGRTHGNNNHYENVSSLRPEAQKRWRELKLEEYDQVFSLRLTGTHRLYGILTDGIFQIVWLDKNHEIYPTSK